MPVGEAHTWQCFTGEAGEGNRWQDEQMTVRACTPGEALQEAEQSAARAQAIEVSTTRLPLDESVAALWPDASVLSIS